MLKVVYLWRTFLRALDKFSAKGIDCNGTILLYTKTRADCFARFYTNSFNPIH